MNRINGCIFDLDGVIVDTAKFHYMAWKRLADYLHIPFNKEDNEKLKGVSRKASLDIILSKGKLVLSDKDKDSLCTIKNNWYLEYISKLTSKDILPGVDEFLTLLKKNNIGIGLGSASKNALLILKNLNIVDYFDSIVDGNMVTKAKPDPEVFLKASELLKILPYECAVFEDSLAGIEAAKSAKMKAIGVGSPEILKAADAVIQDFKAVSLDILRL